MFKRYYQYKKHSELTAHENRKFKEIVKYLNENVFRNSRLSCRQANDHPLCLGTGSSRVTFKLSDLKAIKFEKKDDYYRQNENEDYIYRLRLTDLYKSRVPKIYAYVRESNALIIERVNVLASTFKDQDTHRQERLDKERIFTKQILLLCSVFCYEDTHVFNFGKTDSGKYVILDLGYEDTL